MVDVPGFLGREIELEWGGGPILGCREKGISLNGEPVNISSDEDNGWRKLLSRPGADNDAGENMVDISVSGVSKSPQLMRDWFNGDRQKTLTITYPNGDQISGTFHMATYTDTGTYNDAVTFETTFQSSGEVDFTPYS